MKTPENSKCNRCLHSRFVESENGIHAICTLPHKQAAFCVAGLKDKALYLQERNEHKTPWEIKHSLFRCSEGECHKCYYERECGGYSPSKTLLPDVIDLVVQLEKERDALLKYLTNSTFAPCDICKHDVDGSGVMGCKHIREVGIPCFEWRGIRGENKNGG